MNARHWFPYAIMAVLMIPVAVTAQYPVRDGSVANSAPYLLAAADFGINPEEVTYTKDILPILQRSCMHCHRDGGWGSWAMTSYEVVKAYAPLIKYRTGIRDRHGAMPPFYVEPGIGIQSFKNDNPLSDEELAKIQAWVDNGTPEGDPADMPPMRTDLPERGAWVLGEPDLILRSADVTMPAVGPDRWGDIGLVPTGLTEDRYVKSVEVREVNDIPEDLEITTVGGQVIFHHMTYGSGVLNEEGTELLDDAENLQRWPIHEVGRNADIFGEGVGMVLHAKGALHLRASHLHSTGVREVTGHLEFGYKFHPMDYEPRYKYSGGVGQGSGVDIDVRPHEAGQEFHSYTVLKEHTKIVAYEPHLHAPGVRMCLEAIWGSNRFTLNCVGYDHSWVKQYVYDDDHAPLLPKGTIIHLTGYVDTETNRNLADNRNWAGGGRRSVSNMFLDLGQSAQLTEEQFQAEMAVRRATMKDRNQYDIGCPLCWAPQIMESEMATEGGTQ